VQAAAKTTGRLFYNNIVEKKKKEKSTKVSAVRKFACSGWQAEASWPTCLRRCTATVESKTQTN
jgi:hypothetical protein